MRTDWVPFSASALVIGSMAMVLGAVLNPIAGERGTAVLRAASNSETRWLGMSVMYFVASIFLTLGLPALLSLFVRRGRGLGVVSVGVFAIGTIGLSGFAMLMVFLRSLVGHGLLQADGLDKLGDDTGLALFLYGWIAGFYLGVLLIGIALFLARKTAAWVPALLVLFVALLPLSSQLGRIGSALQVFALAVAFTGIAVAAVSDEHKRELRSQPVF
jgi:hypothetical protein